MRSNNGIESSQVHYLFFFSQTGEVYECATLPISKSTAIIKEKAKMQIK